MCTQGESKWLQSCFTDYLTLLASWGTTHTCLPQACSSPRHTVEVPQTAAEQSQAVLLGATGRFRQARNKKTTGKEERKAERTRRKGCCRNSLHLITVGGLLYRAALWQLLTTPPQGKQSTPGILW